MFIFVVISGVLIEPTGLDAEIDQLVVDFSEAQIFDGVGDAVRSGDRGAVALESSCVEILHKVAAEHAPVGHRGVVPIVTATAGKSVDEDVGVFRVELRFVNLYIRHIQHGEKEHDKRYDKRDDF